MRLLTANQERVRPEDQQAAVEQPDEEVSAWGFVEGDEIVPGRSAVRLLGGGERYEAYLAWDDRLLSLVVVKLLRPSRVDDDSARAALTAEAAMLRRLRHPVIVRSFDAVLDGERPHLVLEHVDGPRLSTLIRTSAISLDQALFLGLQLSAAAHYMGTRDVVHLDIKPQNVIMAGPARLIDLSIAKRTNELGALSSPVGTTRFMAPEQCDTDRFAELGAATDVWGIGITLYWTLAGRSPFPEPEHQSGSALVRRYPQLVQEPAPLPGSVPGPLVDLIRTMLSARADERPSAREVSETLEPLVAALPRPRLSRFRAPQPKARKNYQEVLP